MGFTSNSAGCLDSGIGSGGESFYGIFPVAHLHVMVNSAPGRGVSGTSYAGLEPVLIINLGEAASEHDLQEDWVMVHEIDDAPLAWLRQALTKGSGIVDAGFSPRHIGQEPISKNYLIVLHRLKNRFPEIYGSSKSQFFSLLNG